MSDTTDEPGTSDVELKAGVRPRYMSAITITDRLGNERRRAPYRVTVVFRHPAHAAGFSDDDLRAPRPEGDSGLRISAAPATVVLGEPEVEGGELRISLQVNARGSLARAVADLTTNGSLVARRLVTAHLGSILSRLAFETDAPIAMHYLDVTALDTGDSEAGLIYAGADVELKSWPNWESHPPVFFRSAFAVYREGLISTNAYWAVLCYLRVAEGAVRFRAITARVMKERGMDPARPRPLLEDDEMIVPPWRDWLGKPVTAVLDELKDKLRVALAHGVLPDEPMQAADQIGVENRYWIARPAAQQVARTLVREALEMRERLGSTAVPELDDIAFD